MAVARKQESNEQETTRRAPALAVVPEAGWWTAQQVAAFLAMSRAWVWKQVRLNEGFPFVRLGPQCVRFPVDQVKAWKAAREQESRQ